VNGDPITYTQLTLQPPSLLGLECCKFKGWFDAATTRGFPRVGIIFVSNNPTTPPDTHSSQLVRFPIG
jgi:hypothetical protein